MKDFDTFWTGITQVLTSDDGNDDSFPFPYEVHTLQTSQAMEFFKIAKIMPNYRLALSFWGWRFTPPFFFDVSDDR